MASKWSEKDQKKVREIIDFCAGQFPNGKADMARTLSLKSRKVIDAWRRRGIIPTKYHEWIIRLAAPSMQIAPAMLSPTARLIAKSMRVAA